MQNCCVNIIYLRGVIWVKRLVAPVIAFTKCSAFDPAPAEPVGEYKGIMISACVSLRAGHAAEFGRPQDQRVFEHAALLQIFYKARSTNRHAV